jgi:hypothetical protein
MATDDCVRLERLITGLKPPGSASVPIRPDLLPDECEWFLATLEAGLVQFRECEIGCSRLKRWGVPGPEEFTTPSLQLRHLYSAPGSDVLRLNREYIPHIGAYGYAILHGGFKSEQSAFSRFRAFSKDLLSKRQGQGYETDAEFYATDGQLYLHVEVKRWPGEIERMAAQLDTKEELRRLPGQVLKELEYVLDLTPSYLWIVGPGTIDPPAHVFRVTIDGMNAHFERLNSLPAPT